ncbi:MAG: alpha/beta fold hydrolase [Anaerolineae bacterium]|nr:alpha/beta fold hydrolase [Anaerolineae bacterium]
MPLLFDTALEDLPKVQGINPRPEDHDDYWQRALAEQRGTDPAVELVPADFQSSIADCHHLWFSGTRGARIHAKLLRPKGQSEPGPAVLMFHGYTLDSGAWLDKLGYVAEGYTVASMDVRGQGGRSQETGGHEGPTLHGHVIRGLEGPPDDLLYRQVFLDTVQLARVVMDLPGVDADRVGATGASQGGALTLACAALEPRICRAAPVYPWLTDIRRVFNLRGSSGVSAYDELADWFRRHDPLHKCEEEMFTRLGYIDVQFLAPRIKAETLLVVGLMDDICLPSSQYVSYNRISAPKSVLLYPDFAHEQLPGSEDAIFRFLTA